jgi:hypothetical protein
VKLPLQGYEVIGIEALRDIGRQLYSDGFIAQGSSRET